MIPAIEQRTGAKFVYVPILLGGVFKLTGNQSPMVAVQGRQEQARLQRLETLRFIKKHGLTQLQDEPALSRSTPCRSCAAPWRPRWTASSPKYVDAVFRAMWEDGKKMDEPEVIRAALDAAGLDGARTLARIQEQEVKDRLLKNTEASVARGTFGAPTFFVGDEIFFGKDKLRDVEEEIAAAKAA